MNDLMRVIGTAESIRAIGDTVFDAQAMGQATLEVTDNDSVHVRAETDDLSWLSPSVPYRPNLNPDPESPAAVSLANEIWAEQESSEQIRLEGEESASITAARATEYEKSWPTYIGCAHPFCYGGLESVKMKKYSADQQLELIRMQLRERGVSVGEGGRQQIESQVPSPGKYNYCCTEQS